MMKKSNIAKSILYIFLIILAAIVVGYFVYIGKVI